MVTDDYGINDDFFFAIVLDNASSNKTVMHHLKPVFPWLCHLILSDACTDDHLSEVFLASALCLAYY
jgi:hypothetical protein